MSRSNQRTAYGQALVELGSENPNIVVLDADLCKSTQSVMFQEAYPQRFFEMGINCTFRKLNGYNGHMFFSNMKLFLMKNL